MATEKIIGGKEKDSGPGGVPVLAAAQKETLKVSSQWRSFVRAMVVLAICFSLPLWQLARFALHSDLYSYILIMPLICWYLVGLKKPKLLGDSEPSRGLGLAFLVAGTGVLAYYIFARMSGGQFDLQDALALTTLSFFLFFIGAALVLLGKETMRVMAFPFAMLLFVVPMPVVMEEGVETFLQYASAYVAHGMFKLSGLAFVRDGLVFVLPGVPDGIRVARECSGIHSTFVLFVTSLLAGYFFLRSPWKRLILTLSVIPLGLLRNGFRIFVIGRLCSHYGPQMIDSPIHRRGGPLFFVLSLLPFFALLWWFYKSERQVANVVKP